MRAILPEKLKILAKACPSPLYVVGGSVRDYLAKLSPTIHDWDICSPMSADAFSQIASSQGFFVNAVYRNTGTVKISDGETAYVYSCFRSDKYIRGVHTPVEIFFTTDITLDARRRDFTVNAIAYNPSEGYQDPFGGQQDLSNGILRAVGDPRQRFQEDALRILRGLRFTCRLSGKARPTPPCGNRRHSHYRSCKTRGRKRTGLCVPHHVFRRKNRCRRIFRNGYFHS